MSLFILTIYCLFILLQITEKQFAFSKKFFNRVLNYSPTQFSKINFLPYIFPDFHHSSLDSSGSYREHHLHSGVLQHPQPPITTTSQLNNSFLFSSSTHRQQLINNSNNLMKFKHCPLGHSDPQIYTHTQTPFFVLSGVNNGGGMFGGGGISNSFATTNGSRRSFLSSSPQAFKLKVCLFWFIFE